MTRYPGQCYSLDQQCQLIYGINSRYCNGVSKIKKLKFFSIVLNFKTYNGKNNDFSLCQTLYCKTSSAPGPCISGGSGVTGIGGIGNIESLNKNYANTVFYYIFYTI